MLLSIKNILRVLFCASYLACVTEVFKMLVPVFVNLSVTSFKWFYDPWTLFWSRMPFAGM